MVVQSHNLLTYYYPFSLIIVMFIGPSIYFYVRQLFGYSDSFFKSYVWAHALPALPAIIFFLYFSTLTANERVIWLIEDYEMVRWQEYAINIFFYIQLTCYIVFCMYMVEKQLKRSRYLVFDNKQIDILWLRYFFGISMLAFVIKTIVCVLINSDRVNTLIGLFLMDVIFLYFFIQSIWKTGLSTQTYIELPKVQTPSLKITGEVTDSYIKTLLSVIEQNRIYLSPDCTIEEVAENCNIPRHHLSHILNSNLQKSFSDFINEYRIKHACELLKDGRMAHLTIEALGQECGFGSKASFNRAFKKHTGSTPSEYKQKLRL
ncbi:MAG TPA: AraC family transcriptional regulator [Bacteroidales bacterium]|nr:AraC family transcriptional regulator [Bacteroidales bacterium]